MGKHEKLLRKILRGDPGKNIAFRDLVNLMIHLGFAERTNGDHHIFTKEGVEEILNLQPKKSMAKPYQVKQVRNAILKYRLAGERNA